MFPRGFELASGALREHALHEAKVLQNLRRAFGEDRLEVLGTQMSRIDLREVHASRYERCGREPGASRSQEESRYR
jgi:hypothetical protein